MWKNILLIFNLLVIVLLGLFVFTTGARKTAYVINQEVFEGFAGKVELEKKLSSLKDRHTTWLDSVATLIRQTNNATLIQQYQQQAVAFESEQNDLSSRYSADIWKRINTYMADYGKEKGYDFIYGATGEGTLMYASESHNVTKEVIVYMNDRYKSGE